MEQGEHAAFEAGEVGAVAGGGNDEVTCAGYGGEVDDPVAIGGGLRSRRPPQAMEARPEDRAGSRDYSGNLIP